MENGISWKDLERRFRVKFPQNSECYFASSIDYVRVHTCTWYQSTSGVDKSYTNALSNESLIGSERCADDD